MRRHPGNPASVAGLICVKPADAVLAETAPRASPAPEATANNNIHTQHANTP
jgi:hypothetical protein